MCKGRTLPQRYTSHRILSHVRKAERASLHPLRHLDVAAGELPFCLLLQIGSALYDRLGGPLSAHTQNPVLSTQSTGSSWAKVPRCVSWTSLMTDAAVN
jgi:hypothetical protein